MYSDSSTLKSLRQDDSEQHEIISLSRAVWVGGWVASLASQTPYFSEERERGSGNTAYRKFYQAKECGATNYIASF